MIPVSLRSLISRAPWRRGGLVLAALLVLLAPSASASLLVKNATFLTMKPGETRPVVGYLLADDDGRITALAAGAPPAGTVASQPLSTML